jgi:hypothetical protein
VLPDGSLPRDERDGELPLDVLVEVADDRLLDGAAGGHAVEEGVVRREVGAPPVVGTGVVGTPVVGTRVVGTPVVGTRRAGALLVPAGDHPRPR